MENKMIKIWILVLALLSAALPATAQTSAMPDRIEVTHGTVTPTLVQGESLGAVRTYLVPITVDGKAGANYYLAGTLTTVAIQMSDDQELRASNLTFLFGAEANQIVVGGVSLYPATSSTLAANQKTVRPIIGGSGVYNGARGYTLSTNLGAEGWSHVFYLLK